MIEKVTVQRKVGDGPIRLANIVPEPVYESEEAKETGWYAWRIANWGTKWDLDDYAVFEVFRKSNGTHVRMSATFQTAWSPPLEAIHALSEQFPEVEIEISYDEPGVDISGTACFIGGTCTDHIEGHAAHDDYEDEE